MPSRKNRLNKEEEMQTIFLFAQLIKAKNKTSYWARDEREYYWADVVLIINMSEYFYFHRNWRTIRGEENSNKAKTSKRCAYSFRQRDRKIER